MSSFWPDPRGLWRRLRQNWPLRLFSLAFAIGLWGFVNLGERDAEKTLVLPLELRGVPNSLIVTSPVVDAVDLRVRGPRTLLGTLDDRRQNIVLDLSSIRPGRSDFSIDPSMLSLPRGVEPVRISPSRITLEVDRLVERSVPVVLELAGSPPDGFRLAESEVVPKRVTVSGPAATVDAITEVRTDPVPIRPRAETVATAVTLRRDDPQLRFVPARVEARIRVEDVIASREIRNLEIAVVGGEGEAPRLSHRRARITVRGPERVLRDLGDGIASIEVDVGGLAPGTHRVAVEATVPAGVEIVALEPGEVEARVPAARPAATKTPSR